MWWWALVLFSTAGSLPAWIKEDSCIPRRQWLYYSSVRRPWTSEFHSVGPRLSLILSPPSPLTQATLATVAGSRQRFMPVCRELMRGWRRETVTLPCLSLSLWVTEKMFLDLCYRGDLLQRGTRWLVVVQCWFCFWMAGGSDVWAFLTVCCPLSLGPWGWRLGVRKCCPVYGLSWLDFFFAIFWCFLNFYPPKRACSFQLVSCTCSFIFFKVVSWDTVVVYVFLNEICIPATVDCQGEFVNCTYTL